MVEITIEAKTVNVPHICPICLEPADQQTFIHRNEIVQRATVPIFVCKRHLEDFRGRDRFYNTIGALLGLILVFGTGAFIFLVLQLSVPTEPMIARISITLIGIVLMYGSMGRHVVAVVRVVVKDKFAPSRIRATDQAFNIAGFKPNIMAGGIKSLRLSIEN